MHLYTGPKKVMDEMEQDFLDGLLDIPDHFFAELTTAVQQPELTTAAMQPTSMTSGKCPREALADVDGNVDIPPKQMRKKEPKSMQKSLQNQLEIFSQLLNLKKNKTLQL